MSLLPERISVKRRRHDEPVDILYLDNEGRRNKRRFTDFYYQHLKDGFDAKQSPFYNRRSLHEIGSLSGPQVPVVRATTPAEELRARKWGNIVQGRTEFQSRKEHEALASPNSVFVKTEHPSEKGNGTHGFEHGPHLRRFELVCESARDEDRQTFSMYDQKLKSKNPLATFVEKYAEDDLAGPDVSFESGNNRSHLTATESSMSTTFTRKRPGPSFIKSTGHSEPKIPPASHSTRFNGSAEGKLGDTEDQNPIHWDCESDELASQLEKVALEVIDEGVVNTRQNNDSVQEQGQQGFEELATNTEEEYVYETYVRKPVQDVKLLAETSGEDTRHVGYLVIRETDEGLWDTYVENDEFTDLDEEDYDSNAEDNPANDYPDVDSSEEFDSESLDNEDSDGEDH